MYCKIQWTTFCSHCHSRVVEIACGSFVWIDCLGCGKRILFDFETHHKQGAKTEMTDEEFLRYCETHCETPRAGFVKENFDRLYALMGEEPSPHLRDGVIYPCDPSVMLPWVRRARRHQELLTALNLAAEQFDVYANHHVNTGALEKSSRNADWRDYLRAAASGTPCDPPKIGL